MIYADIHSHEFLLFDKYGNWNREGVNHPALSLEKNYHEFKWFDSFYTTKL